MAIRHNLGGETIKLRDVFFISLFVLEVLVFLVGFSSPLHAVEGGRCESEMPSTLLLQANYNVRTSLDFSNLVSLRDADKDNLHSTLPKNSVVKVYKQVRMSRGIAYQISENPKLYVYRRLNTESQLQCCFDSACEKSGNLVTKFNNTPASLATNEDEPRASARTTTTLSIIAPPSQTKSEIPSLTSPNASSASSPTPNNDRYSCGPNSTLFQDELAEKRAQYPNDNILNNFYSSPLSDLTRESTKDDPLTACLVSAMEKTPSNVIYVRCDADGKRHRLKRKESERACVTPEYVNGVTNSIRLSASCLGIDIHDYFALLNHESHFQANVMSPDGSMGIGQLSKSGPGGAFEIIRKRLDDNVTLPTNCTGSNCQNLQKQCRELMKVTVGDLNDSLKSDDAGSYFKQCDRLGTKHPMLTNIFIGATLYADNLRAVAPVLNTLSKQLPRKEFGDAFENLKRTAQITTYNGGFPQINSALRTLSDELRNFDPPADASKRFLEIVKTNYNGSSRRKNEVADYTRKIKNDMAHLPSTCRNALEPERRIEVDLTKSSSSGNSGTPSTVIRETR